MPFAASAAAAPQVTAECLNSRPPRRLLDHCDAVLRLPGESTGADQDVALAQQRGLPRCGADALSPVPLVGR